MRVRRLVRVFVAPLLMLMGGGALTVVGTSAASEAPHFGSASFGNDFGHRGDSFGTFGHFFGPAYDCTGGNVPPGTYNSMIITGVCYMPAGTVSIRGNLYILPGDLLDGAATPGDPTNNPNPILPATVLVGGNVYVGSGAVLALGCSPAGGCHGVDYDRIGGNVTATGAQGVLIQAVSIGGSVSVLGGGGGVLGGPPNSDGCFAAPIPAPWANDPALSDPNFGSPQYTDFEDSSIGGNLTVIGVQTC